MFNVSVPDKGKIGILELKERCKFSKLDGKIGTLPENILLNKMRDFVPSGNTGSCPVNKFSELSRFRKLEGQVLDISPDNKLMETSKSVNPFGHIEGIVPVSLLSPKKSLVNPDGQDVGTLPIILFCPKSSIVTFGGIAVEFITPFRDLSIQIISVTRWSMHVIPDEEQQSPIKLDIIVGCFVSTCKPIANVIKLGQSTEIL